MSHNQEPTNTAIAILIAAGLVASIGTYHGTQSILSNYLEVTTAYISAVAIGIYAGGLTVWGIRALAAYGRIRQSMRSM